MNDYGHVKTENGNVINLTQDAYIYADGVYKAAGVDNAGNIYEVTWATTKAWDDAQIDFKKTGEIAGWMEDESNACDWSSPIDVKLIS